MSDEKYSAVEEACDMINRRVHVHYCDCGNGIGHIDERCDGLRISLKLAMRGEAAPSPLLCEKHRYGPSTVDMGFRCVVCVAIQQEGLAVSVPEPPLHVDSYGNLYNGEGVVWTAGFRAALAAMGKEPKR